MDHDLKVSKGMESKMVLNKDNIGYQRSRTKWRAFKGIVRC